MTIALAILLSAQVILALAVVRRFGRVVNRTVIPASHQPASLTVAVIIPVLNAEDRILACLQAVLAEARASCEIVEIIVVDGGSTDRTVELVISLAAAEPRLKVVDASPVPQSAVGKAWGLNIGFARSTGEWILTLDADTIIEVGLTRSLAAYVSQNDVDALSVATKQSAPGLLYSLLHPSLLTTLVYRFGPPGLVTRNTRDVLANGQCFFASASALTASGAIQSSLSSLCEDITIVRTLTECGYSVGFFESEIPVHVHMYLSAREAWSNWPRSLIMRDQYFNSLISLRLCRVAMVQAAPLPLVLIAFVVGFPTWFLLGEVVLLAVRIGVLFGTRDGYSAYAPTFWLSPILDLPVAIRLFQVAFQRRFTWRGRVYLRQKGGVISAISGSAGPGESRPVERP